MKNSTNQSTHANAVFENSINKCLNRYLDRDANSLNINEEFIEGARSDLFESFSGEIFANEHQDAWIKLTGSAKNWDVFKNQGDAEYQGSYDDFAAGLVSKYISKTLFSNAVYNASSQIKNPILQSAINKISSELEESFVWDMTTTTMFIEEEALNRYKAIFKNLEINDEIWNEFYNQGRTDLYKKFAETLLNHIESKLSAEYNNIRPELEVLPFPAVLKDLTYEYYSGDTIPDLSQELSGELSEDV